MSNLFYFRSNEGYQIEEKRSRVRKEYVTTENPHIKDIIESHEMDVDKLESKGKNALLDIIRKEVPQEEYASLIDSLFEDSGESGDSFNIKVYQLQNEISKDNLKHSLEHLEGTYLPDSDDDGEYKYSLWLNRTSWREEGFIDIEFETHGKIEDLSEEFAFETKDGDRIEFGEVLRALENADTAEMDLGTDPKDIERPIRDKNENIEARVYPDANVIGISNSGINKGLQGDIRQSIETWGKNDD